MSKQNIINCHDKRISVTPLLFLVHVKDLYKENNTELLTHYYYLLYR